MHPEERERSVYDEYNHTLHLQIAAGLTEISMTLGLIQDLNYLQCCYHTSAQQKNYLKNVYIWRHITVKRVKFLSSDLKE